MSRLFAVIPAAGKSRRMGRPKLLLPLGSGTVLSCLLETLHGSRAFAAIAVVVRSSDSPLAEEVRRCGAYLIQPDSDPPDMRTSVERALEWISSDSDPADNDAWALIPADCPLLRPATLAVILARWSDSDAEILIPSFAGRGGHPTLFRWPLAARVPQLPAGRGLDALVRDPAIRVERFECGGEEVGLDLDTPSDYEQARARWSPETGPPNAADR